MCYWLFVLAIINIINNNTNNIVVTSRSIEELQMQNEKLIASLRELSEKTEREESLTVESK